MRTHQRTAVLLGSLGASAGALMWMTSGLGSALAGWVSISFVSVAIAWWRLWAGLYGKGRWYAAPANIVLLPFMALTWVSWWAATRGREPAHEVAPGLWLGCWPGRGCPSGVERIVDLTAEFPRPGCAQDREYHCLPTLDHTAPDVTRMRRLVDVLHGDPRHTLVHCAMGHGRSATVVAALLMRSGMAVGEAIEKMSSVRPGVGLTDEQRAAAIEAGRGA